MTLFRLPSSHLLEFRVRQLLYSGDGVGQQDGYVVASLFDAPYLIAAGKGSGIDLGNGGVRVGQSEGPKLRVFHCALLDFHRNLVSFFLRPWRWIMFFWGALLFSFDIRKCL